MHYTSKIQVSKCSIHQLDNSSSSKQSSAQANSSEQILASKFISKENKKASYANAYMQANKQPSKWQMHKQTMQGKQSLSKRKQIHKQMYYQVNASKKANV
jgi:hypothetical protein